tara:strand:- start:5492 stop:6721 length:1230 start_codon:yes stop_codon:yes gene_type:complete
MSIEIFMTKFLDNLEVEWHSLDDIGEFLRGKRFVKSDILEKGIPCIHYGELYTHYGIWAKETRSFLSKQVASKLRVANYGDVIIVAAGETIEDIGNGVAWLGNEDVVFHDACFSFKSELNPKYVSYYLRTNLFKVQIKKNISSGKISSINAKGLGKAKIPIPCPENPEKSLQIQAGIVQILDAFTSLTANLTAELTARKKQYNYYRDKLLSFEEDNVEWKPLGDVFNIFAGGDKPKNAFSENETEEFNVPILSNGIGLKSLYGWTNLPKVTEPSLTVSARGTIGWTSYRDRPFFPIIRLIVLTPKIRLNTKYAYYYMKTIENTYPVPPAGIPQLTKPMIENVQFPIPYPGDTEKSLAEQARIVATLDKFDALTNSITEGLPREIELRQKQYEYYRDLLLSFPKPDDEAV